MKRPSRDRTVPWVAAAVLGIVAAVEGLLDPTMQAFPAAAAAGGLVVVAGVTVAAWAPITGSVLATAAFPVTTALGLSGPSGPGLLAYVLTAGWAAYRRPPNRSWLAPVAAQGLATLGVLLAGQLPQAAGVPFNAVWENLFFSGLCWLSWAVGLICRRSGQRAEQLARLAAALDAEREAAEAAAVIHERQRIAREVHDAVAHSVSVMTLQVGAVRSTMTPGSPQTEMLAGIERLGRESVDELRALVGILRDVDEARPSPQPSIARAAELVAEVRAAGLPVRLTEHGERPELPRAVDVSAYRVLQEALTNVLRHAGRVPTEVVLRYAADGLAVEVTDAGSVRPGPAGGPGGHGLIGMRERVAMFGGTLSAGARSEGGFAVRAWFPSGRPT